MSCLAVKNKTPGNFLKSHMGAIVSTGSNYTRVVDKEIAKARISLSQPRTYTIENTISQINQILSSGYASIDYLEKNIKVEKSELEKIICKDSRFKKSLLKAPNGSDVYMLNYSFASLVDFVKFYRHVSFWKV